MTSPNLLSYKSKRSPMQNALTAFFVMFVCFFIFGIIPTQWFAHKYHYDVNLGEALFRFSSFAFYTPSDWVVWGLRLADVPSLKSSVHTLLIIGLISILIAFAFGIYIAVKLAKYSDGMDGLHGTAHWAEYKDVNQKGFIKYKDYSPKGVVIGSIMLDSKNKVIHPHHKKYAVRQEPDTVRGTGIKYFLKTQKRNKEGELLFKPRRSVVKKIEVMRDSGNTHIYAFCPTRSGKGVGLVIPTLLTWADSVFVNDPKGEAYALTAGFRQTAGQVVMKFEPANVDGTTACWNPLEEIRIFTHFDVQDAQMIMSMICDPKGEGLVDYFDKAAFEFLMGLALHMRYAEEKGSLEGIAQFLGDPMWDSDKQMYQHMMEAVHDPEEKMGWLDTMGKPTKTNPVVANTAKTMLNKEDKDRSGVLSTAKSLMSLYLDPIVAKNTSHSDFLVRDMMTGEKPISLYYITGPADMERLVPLTRLFYALFIRRNAAEMEFAEGRTAQTYTFPMLMIIDEMASLKKLPILQEALGYVAGYGIRLFLLSQDITQIEELYGDKQSIDSGAATRIVYAPNKIETAEKLARMSGKTTVKEEKASRSQDVVGFKAGSVSISTDKIARDLITADEFMSLSYSDMVVFVAGQPPIYGRKYFFYENAVLNGRAKLPAPKRSDVLRISSVRAAEQAANEAANSHEDTPVDKWAASRAELKSQVAHVINSDYTSDKAINTSNTSLGEISPTVKQRSRYAAPQKELSDEDRMMIESLVADVALVDKITAISAF